MTNLINLNVDSKQLRERMRLIIEEKAYDRESMLKMSIPDQAENWWIFNLKSFLFDKVISQDLARLFWLEVETLFPEETHFAIGGMESGAIPLISALVLSHPEGKEVSGFFVRKSRKKNDLGNIVEGVIPKDSKVIVVDDILNKGSSYRKIEKVLQSQNDKICAYFSILRYRDKDFYKDEINVPLISLYELNDFKYSLGLKNIRATPKHKNHLVYNNKWAIQLSKPNPYYVCPKSAPIIHEGLIYQGADDGTFFAIKSASGEVFWRYKVSFGSEGKRIFSSPILYKDIVIFGAYDGNLYALNSLTGKKVWIFFDGDAIGSSPCVASDLGIVYIGLEFGLFKKRGGVAAIDCRTGKTVWTYYEMEGLTHASPAYSTKHKMVVCGCNDSKIYCFNARNGKLAWTYLTQGEVKYGATIDEEAGVVYVASLDGCVYALDLRTGALMQKFETLAGLYSNPVLYDGLLIIGSLDRKIYCWNAKDGNLVWSLATSGRIFASPVIHNDILYIGSNDGVLRAIMPRTGTLFGRIILSERIVNKIIIDDNMLYIPTHACELFAFTETVELI